AWSISSGPTDDAAASSLPISDLTVVRTYGDSVSTLVLALGDGRFFLSQEPLEPGEGKIRLGGHRGVIVDGYGTTEQQ
ncbi:hypothetical protein ACQUZK_10425, partial [Streptococcus pyogenes]|uniref:hypothetical protein n=1 Tax=Streptococcus pyogenes TaxID=1314 RepID=UPI003DA179AA